MESSQKLSLPLSHFFPYKSAAISHPETTPSLPLPFNSPPFTLTSSHIPLICNTHIPISPFDRYWGQSGSIELGLGQSNWSYFGGVNGNGFDGSGSFSRIFDGSGLNLDFE
ncbi:hypothetical protein Droror1_Dr00018306 [Drosera rotundifolia]